MHQKYDINSLRLSGAYLCQENTQIASDNGLAAVRRQAIIWINAGILSISP